MVEPIEDAMKTLLLSIFTRTILPPLLGAAGAIFATTFPAYYQAVCGATPLSLPGLF